MRFRIDLKIFLFVILFYITKQVEIYAMIMFFAIIHELGHLVAGLIVGMKPEKMELKPFGFSISFKLKPKDYNIKVKQANILEVKKMIVSLAGPMTNILIILITIFFKINVFKELIIIYSNLLLTIFNILPIYPLDGGRFLKSFLHIFCGKYKSEKYTYNISKVSIIILTVISSIMILYFKNIAIFLAIIYLWIIIIKENNIYLKREKIYKIIEEYK